MNTNPTLKDVVLRIKELTHKTGLARSTIYDKLSPSSKRFDATFPKPIRLGMSSVGWLESEVEAWIASRALARNAQA
ncbi:helix-turn-helix transcriptional regulator [Paraburkholderia terricola]|uniref:helix-turn-helix transcriptional regulator n=1 Tax=Paraburkholderia terricola TaxID=169427 RepID=UPI001FD4DD45|nr:AlpA family transcriptional regulator [Paraburkholderia terricola]